RTPRRLELPERQGRRRDQAQLKFIGQPGRLEPAEFRFEQLIIRFVHVNTCFVSFRISERPYRKRDAAVFAGMPNASPISTNVISPHIFSVITWRCSGGSS